MNYNLLFLILILVGPLLHHSDSDDDTLMIMIEPGDWCVIAL